MGFFEEIANNWHLCYALSLNNIKFTSFSGSIPEGRHVMLSYNWNSRGIVSQIYQYLKGEHIEVWFDEKGDAKDCIYDRYEPRKESFFSGPVVVLFIF